MGRHGEGVHNVAESYYGTSAWDVRFFLLPDRRLTGEEGSAD